MASAVAAAIDRRAPLVVEAGTGVGKTYAYLVPALLSGARTLLSTATKTLQDQLFLRDLPRLRDALGVPVTIALLKGRSQLPVHASPRPRAPGRAAARPVRGAGAGADRGLGADDRERRPRRARGPRRAQQRHSAGDVVARELPRQRMPAVQGLPRQQGPARGDGGRPRGRQPPSVLRRPGAARQRRRRAAAERRGRDLRRGASARRGGRAVPGNDPRLVAADRLRARHAGRRPAAGARPRCRGPSSPRPATGARATCAWPPSAGSARSAASLKLRWAERSGDDGLRRRPGSRSARPAKRRVRRSRR